jgi:hypothetical protein
MNNLLTIEAALLSRTEVKSALRLTDYKAVNNSLLNGAKKLFEQSLAKAAIVAQGAAWWDAEGKALAESAGVTWTKEEFYAKAYGCQKSFAAKLQRAAKVEAEKVEEFKAICDALEAEGKPSKRSIAGLLAWVKDGTKPTDGEGEGEGEEAAAAPVTVFTLAFKRAELSHDADAKNVSVRIDSAGAVTTQNTREEIETAIAFLRAALEA